MFPNLEERNHHSVTENGQTSQQIIKFQTNQSDFMHGQVNGENEENGGRMTLSLCRDQRHNK